jgi:CubicO group peptidase (beta-lactamase class C family)
MKQLMVPTKAFLLLSLAALLGGPANGQATQPVANTTEQILRDVDAKLTAAASQGFGGALIIKRGNQVLLSKGYGFADREKRLAFLPSTVAQIGSVTKSQTGTAIARLISSGAVSLDAPLGQYVREAPEPGRSRTISQLLSHSSGLVDTCAEDFDPLGEGEFVSRCLAIPLAFKPGENHYSNMGYSALALVVQRVTKREWESEVRSAVWRPLKLRAIGFTFDEKADATFARGYQDGVPQTVISRSIAKLHGKDWTLRGNGGVQASAEAMIAFLDGVLAAQGKLPSQARHLLLNPVPGQVGSTRQGFGLEFNYDDMGKLDRVGHFGTDGVFLSYLCWLPGNDVRFYFVGNSGIADVQTQLKAVLKAAVNLPAEPS